jgi:uncharacterized protein YbjT (DUF2867 family)
MDETDLRGILPMPPSVPTTRPVLVTGATGNAGREVTAALRRRGLPLREARRNGDAAPDAVALDFTDAVTWDRALEGCGALFLMRPPPISDMRGTLIPFVARARALGVRRVVFLSVIGAEGSRWIPHAAVERALMAGPADWTILRAGFFAQNLHDAYRRDIREEDRIHVPAGAGRVAFLDLRDLAEVAVHALATDDLLGRAIDLTGPEAVSFADVASALGTALGRPIRYEPASVWGYVRHLRRRGAPWMAALIQARLHVGLRWGEAEAVLPDIPRILGRPATPVAEVIARDTGPWSRDPE